MPRAITVAHVRLLMYWRSWEEHVPFLLSKIYDVEFDTWGHGDERGIVLRVFMPELTPQSQLHDTLRYGHSFTNKEVVHAALDYLSDLSRVSVGQAVNWRTRVDCVVFVTGVPDLAQQQDLNEKIYGRTWTPRTLVDSGTDLVLQ